MSPILLFSRDLTQTGGHRIRRGTLCSATRDQIHHVSRTKFVAFMTGDTVSLDHLESQIISSSSHDVRDLINGDFVSLVRLTFIRVSLESANIKVNGRS